MKILFTILLSILITSISICQINEEIQNNIYKAVEHYDKQEFAESIIYLDRLIEEKPGDYISIAMKAKALFNLGEEKKALYYINKSIELNPKYYTAYADRAHMAHLTKGYDLDKVLNDIEMALLENEKDIEHLEFKAHLLLEKMEYNDAIIQYSKVLKMDSNRYLATVMRGTAKKRLGNFRKALDDYDLAIKIDSGNTIAFEERAFLYLETEDYDKAVDDFNTIIKSKREFDQAKDLKAYTLNNLGFAKFKNGDVENGLIDINTSIELYPQNSYAYKNRALILISQKQSDAACEDLNKAKQLGYKERFGNEVNELINKTCN